MRPVLAAIIWVILIGGLSAYMHQRERAHPPVTYRFHEAAGVFSLEVVTTFTVEPDPFALTVEGDRPSALLVRVNGKEVVRKTDRLEPGVPLRVEGIAGIVDGPNEFYVEASPPVTSAAQYHAVRVRVLMDGQMVGEHSSWSEPGARIADTFPLTVAAGPPKEHGRDH